MPFCSLPALTWCRAMAGKTHWISMRPASSFAVAIFIITQGDLHVRCRTVRSLQRYFSTPDSRCVLSLAVRRFITCTKRRGLGLYVGHYRPADCGWHPGGLRLFHSDYSALSMFFSNTIGVFANHFVGWRAALKICLSVMDD